ncbi:hypothetical protein BJ994_003544 [Arthrobacter pigmenti]|uniref:ISXO2-like transposase domain-containing protein n=1 Tax=Arthrobacter pigmenti TaxID=271432 RepID=A0A846RM36_9MICC|nr:hypothetical protein [Arthrobacter pigmenti]
MPRERKHSYAWSLRLPMRGVRPPPDGDLQDRSAASLHSFLTGDVEPGAHVITEGWQGYRGIETTRLHSRIAQPALPRAVATRVNFFPKCTGWRRWPRWLLGTHQGGADEAQLQNYLDDSSSDSTRAHPAAGGWSSTACLNLPLVNIRCAAAPWSATAAETGPPMPPGRRSHPHSMERPTQPEHEERV